MEEKIDELIKKVDTLTKSVNKMTRLTTLIAKSLHLVPITEAEEKNMQLLKRKNEELAYKINDELENMENKAKEFAENALGNIFQDAGSVYGDVLGDDLLGTIYKGSEE